MATHGEIKVTRFTASGSWTVDPLTVYAVIECWGGGGSGGRISGSQNGTFHVSAGGNSGGYGRKTFNKADINAGPYNVTVGAGGTTGNGSASRVATSPNAAGVGGLTGPSQSSGQLVPTVYTSSDAGSPNADQTAQDILTHSRIGKSGIALDSTVGGRMTGFGTAGSLGAGNPGAHTPTAEPANTGAGGGGTGAFNSTGIPSSSKNGGAGGSGQVVITEYLGPS